MLIYESMYMKTQEKLNSEKVGELMFTALSFYRLSSFNKGS